MSGKKRSEEPPGRGETVSEKETARAALSASSELLRVTLASIGDAVITTDAHGRVVYLNPVAQTLTGWTQEDAVGNSLERVFRIVNEETRQTVENPALRALRDGQVVGIANHTVLSAKDGTEHHIDDSAAPIRDANGAIVGVVLVFRDIGERRRLEKQKAEALAFAQDLLSTFPHPFLVLDEDLKVKSANASFYRCFQATPEETIGHPLHGLGSGQWNLPALRTRLEEILPDEDWLEGLVVDQEFPKIGRFVFKVNARRIRNGTLDGRGLTLMVIEDVTERFRLEASVHKSEVRYRRLFQTAKDGILILDANTGKILDANAFMAGLTGQDLPEILGKELHEIGLFEDVAANKSAFKALQENGYVRYDHLPIQNKNGNTTDVEFVSNVYSEGLRQVAQCNIRDISTRVAMEQQILAQTQALADQHRRKDEFLAMLSHELRSPLAPIRSATHLLRLQERGSENLIAQQAREVIERQVANLTRLVSDLLEVSRIVNDRIRLKRETIDMSQVVQHALVTVSAIIMRQGHEVSTTYPDPDSEPLWVHADPTRLEQVVINLLTNAAKFTDKGGRIGVSVERSHDHVVLRVSDSGIGIAPEVLPHIFDLFSQADRSLDRSQGGLGVGLSIVQKLVEMHGGAVEARSEGLGRGSEFVVRLPVSTAPGERPAPPTTPTDQHGDHTLRVLVVDDNVDGCEMLAHLLRLQEYGVQIAHTGPEAIAITQSWRPDVVLLDIGLPGLDGYEVARRLRADPTLKGLKLIATTGYGNEKDLQLSREAGFDAHLVKPIELSDVERLLRQWNRPLAGGGEGPSDPAMRHSPRAPAEPPTEPWKRRRGPEGPVVSSDPSGQSA